MKRNLIDLMVGCSLLPVGTMFAQQPKTPRPNVVFILMDDLGYGDVQCYGQQKIETPNIDFLRQQGMKFTQFYSGSPVSAPARCVLMTGLHTGHSQIRGNDEIASRGATQDYDSMYVHKELEGQYPLKAGTFTLGKLMQKAGYITGCFGKWGLGYPGSEGTPGKQGFNQFYGYNCQRQAHTYYPAFLYDNDERVYLQNKVMDPHKGVLGKDEDPNDEANYARFQQKDYANDFIFDALMKFVDKNEHNPFFVMWTTPLPHVSLQAPERWVKYYVKKFGDEKPSIKNGYLPCRYPHATYAAMISYFDEQIGKLVAKLKADGVYDNTLFVFTSDNGPTFNGGSDSPWFNSGGIFKSEYGWGKCFVHEGGIRVPTIMSWKGHIKAGSESSHIGSFQDFMPTFAALTGVKCPPTDGLNFMPTLLGQKNKQKEHEYLYWEFNEIKGAKAVRMGKWKGILDDIKAGNTTMQLFDLDKDIKELHDVAAEHPDIVKKMQVIMKKESVEPENKKFKL